MNKYIDSRKHKEEKPVVAICYDFDKTLSPTDMQAQGFIQSVGCDVNEFWDECNELGEKNDMDQNLAYMLTMQQKSEGKVLFTKDKLIEYGAKVELFNGVETWFQRIKEYGESHGVIVEHYIISSGLKEMIQGTKVASEFEKIYATSFYYNEKGVAVWPAQVVNYTNKTQYLFRIEKGVLDINDSGVNESFEPSEIRVPFRNMIYIGDSDTDIPCMKLIMVNGGYSIAVYDPKTNNKNKAYKMMREKRIKFYAPADYSEGKELDFIVKSIIDRTSANEKLENLFYQQQKEQIKSDKEQGEEKRNKIDAILKLRQSLSYASTHAAIENLIKITNWSADEREEIFKIAVENSQVYGVLNDADVKAFFNKLIDESKSLSPFAKKIFNTINIIK
ncbi:MAG: haloacid dehalogenase-like hydrolase [Clostridia bacterium]|nr:haloacid dehalogenase-like hydrolase [Clostridia bacterium]